MVVYLGNILIMGSSLEEVSCHTRHLTDSGFYSNIKKSVLKPARNQEFLGVNVDSRSIKLFIPREKIKQMRYEIKKSIGRFSGQPKSGQLAGSDECNDHCHSDFTSESSLDSTRPFSRTEATFTLGDRNITDSVEQAGAGLVDRQYPGLEWDIIMLDEIVKGGSTDASKQGFGIVSDHLTTQGLWSLTEQAESINFLELKTILLSLQLHQDQWKGKVIQVQSYNTTAISYINGIGGARAPPTSQSNLGDLHGKTKSITSSSLGKIQNVRAGSSATVIPSNSTRN